MVIGDHDRKELSYILCALCSLCNILVRVSWIGGSFLRGTAGSGVVSILSIRQLLSVPLVGGEGSSNQNPKKEENQNHKKIEKKQNKNKTI